MVDYELSVTQKKDGIFSRTILIHISNVLSIGSSHSEAWSNIALRAIVSLDKERSSLEISLW